MAIARRREPRLDHTILRDPEAVDEAQAKLLADDPKYRAHRRRILRRRRRLRRLLTEEAWRDYLKVEEAWAARLAYVMDVLTKWAFVQGSSR